MFQGRSGKIFVFACSRTPSLRLNTTNRRFKTAQIHIKMHSKGVAQAYTIKRFVFNGFMQPNHRHCLLKDAINTVQHIPQTLQDGSNAFPHAKGVVEAYRLKGLSLVDVLAKSLFFVAQGRLHYG